MKKNSLILLALILLFVLVVSGCSQTERDAKEAFENTMQAFKSGDKNEIEKYYSFSMVTAYIDKEDGEVYRDAIISTLKNLDYKINSVKKLNDKSVSINVNLTGADFSKITESYIKKLTDTIDSSQYKQNVKNMTENEYKKLVSDLMIEAINENSDSKHTKTIDAVMINTESGWLIGGDSDAFLGALFANLSNVVNAMS